MQNSQGDARHTEQIEAHGLKALRLRASGSEALVYLQGAHVASFSTAEHGELLWLSEQAVYAPGKAIRGGIPVCFPWFGPHGTEPRFPAHGFARTREFHFEGSELRGNVVVAELTLAGSSETAPWFPHSFIARLRVSVGPELCVAFEVKNTGASDFDYEVALHTYLGVSEVRQVSVEGLAGAIYVDKVSGESGLVQEPAPLLFTGETDRVYESSSRVTVTDPARRRRTIVDKTSSRTTVVWNPWVAKAQRMADFGDEEWPGMLCVEAANVSPHGIHLIPQSRHTTTTIVSAETL
ncbi:MAG: D-hexose-6-phosphate mutarotase [Polyangiaceae bacterium]|jgi:glucose-6-phosphate 1-epimerase|nr:D-hexose-6-phosphate mutarotase [Polyangiaceae bacterium]